MIPLLLWILSPHFPWRDNGAQEVSAAVLFVLASITDGVDGYLARKRGQITTIGMLLDPLADKVMVTGAIIALVAYNPEVMKVWIAVVIISREFLISGLRSIASSEGFTIQASDLGKPSKTVIRDCVRGVGHPGTSMGPLVSGPCGNSGAVDCRCRRLLHGAGFNHLGGRLLCGLLEADRSCFERPPQVVCTDSPRAVASSKPARAIRKPGTMAGLIQRELATQNAAGNFAASALRPLPRQVQQRELRRPWLLRREPHACADGPRA